MQRRTIARQHFVCGTAAEQTPRRYFYLPYCKRERPRPELSLQHRSVGGPTKKSFRSLSKCFRYFSAVLQAGVSLTRTFSAECAHTPSRSTEGRQGRMVMWLLAFGWHGSVVSSKACYSYFPDVSKRKNIQRLKFAPRSSSPVFTCRLLRFNYHISSTCLHVFSKMIIRCCCHFLSLVVFPFLVLKFSVLFRVRSSVFRALQELVLSLPCVSRSFHLFSLILFPF